MPEPRLVCVTGGTRGLGRALSLRFASEGDEVWAAYRSNDEAARATEELAAGLPGPVRTLRWDVTTASPPALPTLPADRHLVLVHAATAPFAPRPLHLVPETELTALVDVAVRGAFHAARAFLRPMVRAKRGTVVTVLSSVVHGEPPKGFSAYAAAKHGLLGLTRALAVEYRPHGVRVFSVSPGYMDTELTRDWDPAFRAAAGPGAVTDPARVAELVFVCVASPDTPGTGEDYAVGPTVG